MTVITLPTCPPLGRINWRYNQPTELNRSEWTNKSKGAILPAAAMYYADIEAFRLTTLAQFHAWNAFFGDLQGRANTFRLPLVRRAQRTSIPVRVNGADQTGYNLVTDGWDGTGLPRGASITVNDQAMKLTADVVPSGGGATLRFDRWLRRSPPDNTLVVVDIPTVLVSLADDTTQISDDQISIDPAKGWWTVPAFSVEEKF